LTNVAGAIACSSVAAWSNKLRLCLPTMSGKRAKDPARSYYRSEKLISTIQRRDRQQPFGHSAADDIRPSCQTANRQAQFSRPTTLS